LAEDGRGARRDGTAMHRSLLLAVAAALLMPATAQAGALYYVDVSVRKSVVVDTKCPDGSRHFDEVSDIWRSSGSGRLPGTDGIVAITRERLTASLHLPAGGGEPAEEKDTKLLSERDRGLRRVARWKRGRIQLDLGNMSPLERKLRVRPPGPESRVDLDETVKERREKGETDANGCTPTTIRATEIGGSVQRLR
jgi:hypothetical protein